MIYCINLDRRKDKWLHAQEEFRKRDLSVQRFSAIDGGWRGCRDSHLAVMDMHRKDQDEKHVTFEDDVLFLLDRTIEVSDKWDFLSFGCSPQEPLEQFSEDLFILNKKALCMHAYAINNRHGLIDFVLNNRQNIGKIDVWFSENVYTNPAFKCYLSYPLICTQKQFSSDTCKVSDVSTIEKNYAKFVTAYAK